MVERKRVYEPPRIFDFGGVVVRAQGATGAVCGSGSDNSGPATTCSNGDSNSGSASQCYQGASNFGDGATCLNGNGNWQTASLCTNGNQNTHGTCDNGGSNTP